MSMDQSSFFSPFSVDSENANSDGLSDVDVRTSAAEGTLVPENSGEREVTSSSDLNLEPYVGQEFKSEQEARAFYNGYARYSGFSIRKGPLYRSARDRSVTSRIFVCSREGFRRETSALNERGNIKRRMAVTRVGCKAQLWVKKQDSGNWVVKQFQPEHNHNLAPTTVHRLRSHKNMIDNLKEYVETLKGAGVDTSKIQSLFVEEARGMSNAGVSENDVESEDKKKIRELSTELHRERRRSAAYQEQLRKLLKDMEDHAQHLSKQIEDIVGDMKDLEGNNRLS
ncbi:hypothetical protein AQUCO_05800085v1 [Aquilegia coerulea]|uniref:FAR1 domain-containing protein n=1 Tax=Aquilegia coerulea TaxID=218851 RepID=A0A2G5CEL7_AQUCA|nr:hypothetical protein AQUCO_05800085v1 [Aquilegia coerulea]PIA29742.1 hypothetical protein AQUCO_05800085v1 [Aquilegia coerulea]